MCKTLQDKNSTDYLQNVIEGISVSNINIFSFHKEIEKLVLTSPDRNIVKYGLYLMTIGEVDVGQ